MKFEIHPEVAFEAREARDWYDEQSSFAGDVFQSSLRIAFDLIRDAPARWPIGIHRTRYLRLDRFPYLIIYRFLPSEILVVAVAHHARKPGYWKNRLGG
jgi:hypothetical protein